MLNTLAPPTIRPAELDDLPAILAIFNHAVVHTTAVWIDEPVDLANRRAWFEARRAAGFPILVSCGGDAVTGFASFGDFRAFPGYRHTVEHSIYVRDGLRGSGTGSVLLQALEAQAQKLGKHRMIGGVDGENLGSIRFHQRRGYRITGRLTEVGIKFGRWLDLVFMEKPL